MTLNIFHRGAPDANGRYPQPVAYAHQDRQYTLITAAKELASTLLSSPGAWQTLLSIANECESIRPQQTDTNPINLEAMVQTFIDAMSSEATFPAIIVDDAVTANTLGKLQIDRGMILEGEVPFQSFEISINSRVCIIRRVRFGLEYTN